MYDYLLGGGDNYEVDRAACAELIRIAPSSKALALANRAFLRRAVRFLAAECEVRQFLDHGSGLPTRDNVHQIAQRIDHTSRVVYLDNDPTVVAHSRSTLAENDATAVLYADMRNTDSVFDSAAVKRLIRRDEATAALFVSVLHCLPDSDEPGELLKRVAGRLAPRSYLVVCQLVSDDPRVAHDVTDLMAEATHGKWGRVRTKDEVRAYLADWDVLDPGLVEVARWRPDGDLPLRREGAEWEAWGGVVRL